MLLRSGGFRWLLPNKPSLHQTRGGSARSAPVHPLATFRETGGQPVQVDRLREIQTAIREIAKAFGYPVPSRRQFGAFDAQCAEILHERMDTQPSETANEAIWAFLACVLLPDIVRWRLYQEAGSTNEERFLGGVRGTRNTFGRLWWRAYTLYEPEARRPYHLLYDLGEDALVQLMERPALSGHRATARYICSSVLSCIRPEDPTDPAARTPLAYRADQLMRQLNKRLVRLLSVVTFDALTDSERADMVDRAIADTLRALRGHAPEPRHQEHNEDLRV